MLELADERLAAKEAINSLRLTPVLFELGARPHPPRELYRAYLDQSHIFIGIYWQRYGWIAPDMDISGLEDEYLLASQKPKLIYIKEPAPERESRLNDLLLKIMDDNTVSFKLFSTPAELRELIQDDLALMLTERFQIVQGGVAPSQPPSSKRLENIPVPTTPIIGRQVELSAVSELLERPEVRLVTLHGPGGIGKTRLAIEVAHKLSKVFIDGVCFVSLSNVTDHRLIIPTIAKEIGLVESSARSLQDSLEEYLRQRNFLLVLDNFEQVTQAAEIVNVLLTRSTQLKILVTSRAVLHLLGEYQYAIPPLTLPDQEALRSFQAGDFSNLSQFSALTLFVQNAQRIKSSFEITQDNILAIAEICRHLDGLPLAIELAAARIKLFSPQAMHTRLEESLQWLTSGARDLPTRQQTLRTTIEWSYSLLEPPEQNLFRHMAVFVGGCSLDALQAVCIAYTEMELLENLASLVDKSLVQQEEDSAGEPRFSMLLTIQEYAQGLLDASPEADELRQRHADYYLKMVETAEPELRGPKQLVWFRMLEREYDNIRAVVRRSLARGQVDRVVRISWALWYFWWNHGYLAESTLWIETVLEKEADLPIQLRARAMYVRGFLHYLQGHYQETVPIRGDLVDRFRQAGDRWGEALIYCAFGLVFTHVNRFEEARQNLEKGLALYSELGDKWGIAFATVSLGQLKVASGDLEGSIVHLAEGVALYWEAGDKSAIVFAQYFLAMTLLLQNDPDWAYSLLQSGLSLAVELNLKYYLANCLEGLAGVAAVRGQAERAAQLWGAALAIREASANPCSPTEQALYEPLLARARAQLPEKTFEEYLVAGKAMPFSAAIALAGESSN
jgi:predicted ATPase